MNQQFSSPTRSLTVFDAVAVIVGIVIGFGIFRLPALVAGQVESEWIFLGVWVAGGLISLIGALCYAELATTYPNVGGDYHFLGRAFGSSVSFLFAWARLTVIQTGSIALAAFVVGEYASEIFPLGMHSKSIYAATTVTLLTALQMAGVQQGKWTQNVLIMCVLAGLALVIGAGARAILEVGSSAPTAGAAGGSIGLAMVFVLYTYGGWNEAAYLSAEVRGGRRPILWALLMSIGLITAVYVLVNAAMLWGLGLERMAGSTIVAADLLRSTWGQGAAIFISLLIVVAALSTTNGSIFTGARTNYALGRDFAVFSFLGRWRARGSTPANALLVQGAIALALVGFGTITAGGVLTMVEYTAPVFWFFFLLVGVALIVLRQRDPGASRPFRVPLYPLTPLLFIAACVYMLHASVNYTRMGALVGIAVLCLGVPVLMLSRVRRSDEQHAHA